MKGTVKSWNTTKGFGFIGVDGGEDAFVHVSEIPSNMDWLAVGEKVEFDYGEGRDGRKCAVAVVVLD